MKIFGLPEPGFPGQFMKPWPFFAGILIGFFTCCQIGLNCQKINPFIDFQRFHYFICQYSSFYPTINELMALAVDGARDDQIIVIVAGDSIFNGMGQSIDHLWTNTLKEKLGGRFHVVNLAIHGTTTFESGYCVAEALARKGRRVLCVTNTQPGWTGLLEGYQLASVCFSAMNRGLLFPFDVRQYLIKKDIESFNLGRDLDTFSFGNSSRLKELDLGTKIDAVVNAYDLWHLIGYRTVFTIWDKKTHPNFLRPRKVFLDQPITEVENALSEENLKVRAEELRQREKNLIAEGSFAARDNAWNNFEDMIKQALPQGMRRYVLVVMTRSNPLVLGELSENERERDRATFVCASQKWMKYGYNALVFGDDLEPQDYCDTNHFSNEGGEKLAREVSIAIRVVATKVGYIERPK